MTLTALLQLSPTAQHTQIPQLPNTQPETSLLPCQLQAALVYNAVITCLVTSEVGVVVTEPKGARLEEDEVDLRAYRPAGGPILLQALELPPQPKTVNNWIIKKGGLVVWKFMCCVVVEVYRCSFSIQYRVVHFWKFMLCTILHGNVVKYLLATDVIYSSHSLVFFIIDTLPISFVQSFPRLCPCSRTLPWCHAHSPLRKTRMR